MSISIINRGGASGGLTGSIFVTGLDEGSTVEATHKIPGKSTLLPEGYTHLEYIESTGTQWCDSGFIPTVGSRVEVGYQATYVPTQSEGDSWIAALYQGTVQVRAGFQAGNFCTAGGFSYSQTADKTAYTVATTTCSVNASIPLYLFAQNLINSGVEWVSNSKYKMYYCKMWNTDGSPARDFIPARRDSDSVIGLYDLVNNMFYTNAGTGSFIAGAEVIQYVDGKTINGVWTQRKNPAVVIPDGYTQLEYIESTGTQYIDTGFAYSSSMLATLDISVDFQYTAKESNSRFVFGDAMNFGLNWYNGTDIYIYYNNMTANTGFTDGLTRHVYRQIGVNGYVDETLKLTKSASGSYSGTIKLFSNGAQGQTKGKLYSCSITDNGTLVRNLVPAKRNSDNTVGMYDTVSSTLYTNKGTGTFVAGAEIPSTVDGHMISKIKDLGTWTVTATNGEKTETESVVMDVIGLYEIEMSYKLWLYRDGDECEDVTGGWSVQTDSRFASYGGNNNSYKDTDHLTVSLARTNTQAASMIGGFITNNRIDTSGYTKLCVEFAVLSGNNQYHACWGLFETPITSGGSATAFSDYLASNTIVADNTIKEVDISSEAYNRYVGVHGHVIGSYASIDFNVCNVWLE